MADLTVPLSKLLLDELNPRHRPVTEPRSTGSGVGVSVV